MCQQECFSCRQSYCLLGKWSTYADGRSSPVGVGYVFITRCSTVRVNLLRIHSRQCNLLSRWITDFLSFFGHCLYPQVCYIPLTWFRNRIHGLWMSCHTNIFGLKGVCQTTRSIDVLFWQDGEQRGISPLKIAVDLLLFVVLQLGNTLLKKSLTDIWTNNSVHWLSENLEHALTSLVS